jgi:hypothetical protein
MAGAYFNLIDAEPLLDKVVIVRGCKHNAFLGARLGREQASSIEAVQQRAFDSVRVE